jgi:hypothetical protein
VEDHLALSRSTARFSVSKIQGQGPSHHRRSWLPSMSARRSSRPVTDSARSLLLKPRTGCPMTRPSQSRVVADIVEVLPVDAVVKVGIEASGHYHRPLLHASWPIGWEVLELNPGHVTEADSSPDPRPTP